MGLLEQRRRRKHRNAINWDMMAPMMLLGHELGLAEAAGFEEDSQGEQAMEVRDSVLDAIGGMDRFTETLIDSHFERGSSSDMQIALDRALARSRYNEVRGRLFPELPQQRVKPPAREGHDANFGSSGETTDVNSRAISHARIDATMASWLGEAAGQIDRRLDAISPGWREAEQAEAARACAFGLLLANLARTYPHAREAIHQVVEAHPSYEALAKGSRLATLERIAEDRGRMTAWMGQLIRLDDPGRMERLLD